VRATEGALSTVPLGGALGETGPGTYDAAGDRASRPRPPVSDARRNDWTSDTDT
jgi:hypothetical protein